jgi:hypothetical protein
MYGTVVALLAGMAEMTMLRFDDLAPYAEARQLAHVARDATNLARHADHLSTLRELTALTLLVLGTIAETLRAGDPRLELRGFRGALALLADVRVLAYDAYLIHALPARQFDDLMLAARRCERELARSVASAHRRARLALDAA